MGASRQTNFIESVKCADCLDAPQTQFGRGAKKGWWTSSGYQADIVESLGARFFVFWRAARKRHLGGDPPGVIGVNESEVRGGADEVLERACPPAIRVLLEFVFERKANQRETPIATQTAKEVRKA